MFRLKQIISEIVLTMTRLPIQTHTNHRYKHECSVNGRPMCCNEWHVCDWTPFCNQGICSCYIMITSACSDHVQTIKSLINIYKGYDTWWVSPLFLFPSSYLFIYFLLQQFYNERKHLDLDYRPMLQCFVFGAVLITTVDALHVMYLHKYTKANSSKSTKTWREIYIYCLRRPCNCHLPGIKYNDETYFLNKGQSVLPFYINIDEIKILIWEEILMLWYKDKIYDEVVENSRCLAQLKNWSIFQTKIMS